MPGIPRVYIPFDKEIDGLADEERRKRIETIQKARKYYNGDHDKPLKVNPMERDDNIILNLAGQTIDKTTDFIGTPTFSTANEGDEDVEKVLETIVRACDMPFLVPDVLTSGQVSGHAFLKIIPPEGEMSRDNPPVLAQLDPQYVTVFWDKGFYGMRKALWYRLEWEYGKITRRQDIVPANLIPDESGNVNENAEGWFILEYEKSTNDSSTDNRQWKLIAADEWAYPFAPIIDCKNRRKPHSFYGESDLRDLGLNDAINFVVSNTARIIKFHAHPRTVLFGDDGASIKATEVGGLWAIPNDEASIQNLEMQSDLASSMEMLDMLRSSWFSQARVIDLSTQKERAGQLTNFSVRMLFNDMIEMAGDKQLAYGRLLESGLERILFMLGIDADVIAHWDDPLPTNRLEVVQTAEAEQNMGVSKTTTFKDLGRDYEAEQKKVAEETANTARNTANRFLNEAQFGAIN